MLNIITKSRRNAYRTSKQAGVTLVELSIVIIIMGLIVGGVVQGQTLIDNARLQSIMREVEQFKTPAFAFEDKYQSLPGDMYSAESEEIFAVEGGNGNGVIGDLYDNIYQPISDNTDSARENRAYWNHLTVSGVLTSSLRSFPGDEIDNIDNMRFGVMFPRSRLQGAGYTSFRYTANEGTPTERTAYWLRLHRSATGDAIGALTPEQAMTLDRKFDDGMANNGSIRAGEDAVDGSGSCLGESSETGYYQISTAEPECIVIFQLL